MFPDVQQGLYHSEIGFVVCARQTDREVRRFSKVEICD